jgi:hypothetical protein
MLKMLTYRHSLIPENLKKENANSVVRFNLLMLQFFTQKSMNIKESARTVLNKEVRIMLMLLTL